MIRARFWFVFLSLVLAVSASAQLQSGSPWPKFHQNTLNTGVGVGGGSNGLVRWQFQAGNRIFSGPAIAADGTIYMGSDDFNVYALNPNGTQKWSFPTQGEVESSPAIGSDGTIYVGSFDNNLYAINPNGTQKWAFATGAGVYSSPTIGSDGTIYVDSEDDNLYAINPNGTKKWAFLTGNFIDTSPAIGSDGTIYIGSQDARLYAVNPDGTMKWSFYATYGVPSSPSIAADGTIYFGDYDNVLYALNPDGTPKWEQFLGSEVVSSPAIGPDGTIYVGDYNGFVYALNPPDGSIKWSYLIGNFYNIASSPAVGLDGTVYIGGYDENLYAFTPSGTVAWSFFTGGSVSASPAIGPDGTVYIGSLDGILSAVGTEVNTIPVSSLTVSPTTITGGTNDLATVTLTSAAPAGGDVVSVSSNSSAAAPPAIVTVPAGQMSASFFVATYAVGNLTPATITATSGGVNVTAVLTVRPVALTSLVLSPTSIGGGGTSIGTVTLPSGAAAPGLTVNLSTEYPASVQVPASIVIPTGATSATFPITAGQFSNTFVCGIYATDGNSGVQANLTVVGDSLASLTLNPTTIGGGETSAGTVTLTSPAPSAGWVVNLSTEYPNSVSVPTTVGVLPGATSATFTITPKQFLNTFVCGIYASDNVTGKQANLTVQGDSLLSLTLNPTTIGGNGTSTGTITLISPAPPGGWVVAVSDEYPSSVSVPASVTVPAGATSTTFPITSRQFSNTFVCGIYVSDNTTGKQANLTVVGDSLASLTLNPSSVVGGNSSTGTVTLTAAAPAGGWVVQLSTEYPSTDGVPATVVVPAGAMSANFTITTKTTTTTYGCGVYSTDGTSGKNAVLTVTHS